MLNTLKSYFNLKSGRIFSCRPILDYRRHEDNQSPYDHILSDNEFPSDLRVQQMCKSLPRQSTHQDVLNSQAVLDRSMYICARGHSQKEVDARNDSLHNFTGGKCFII